MTAARTPLTPAASADALGLRERKKLKTRLAIRRATYGLIESQGYEATTIEQIADAAEVSPSTVFRYFPTKEDIVLTDEYDPVMEAELRDRPLDEPMLESLRYIITAHVRAILEQGGEDERKELYVRTKLMIEVPAVRSRMMESMSVTGRLVCRVIAERTGRDADDLKVRVFAMGVIGSLMEALLYWGEHGCEDDLVALVNEALDVFKDGW
ncbi:TetR/AcrR family transcriptional regulator [Streptomyces monticola]|uniref:TetR/AcrR family transcriptional regulator n=1 Tax=Streptomyces monticola TaxID=2666263 RepID=A0ABW2JGW1_9ACTN